jgi:altronate dehydratase small subunit
MARGFQVKVEDNVATLLEDAVAGDRIEVLGAAPSVLELREAVLLGHKTALREIPAGEAVIKFGVSIGVATHPIRPGEWVHLQNCGSSVDERSGTLDLHTGAATDTVYE